MIKNRIIMDRPKSLLIEIQTADNTMLNDYVLGVLSAIFSAGFMASQRITSRRGMVGEKGLSPNIGVMITIIISIVYMGILIVILGKIGELLHLSSKTILSLGAAGIIHFVVGRTLSYSAYKYIGINYSSPYIALKSFYAIIFGIVFLGERPSWLSALSAFLLLSGVLVISIFEPRSSEKQILQENVRKGILCALVAGLAFGSSAPLIRLGLLSSGSAITGPFVSYSFAFLVYLPVMIFIEKIGEFRKLEKQNAKYFFLSGIFVNTAHVTRYFALASVPLWIAMPLLSSNTIFSLVLTSVTLRKYEVFSPPVIAGVVLSIIGVILIAFTNLS